MKPCLASILKLVIAFTSVSLVVAGCAAPTLCIKTVDAETGQPLAGVSTSWRQDHNGYFHLEHEGPTNLPPSGQDGIISVEGLHRDWGSRFIFSCPGHSNVYGFYSVGKMGLAERVTYLPPGPLEGEFILDGNLTSAFQSNGCFLVKMPR